MSHTRSPLPVDKHGQILNALSRLPLSRFMHPGPTTVTTHDQLVTFLNIYGDMIERKLDESTDRAKAGRRAATVLNGLRRDLDNAVSTLAELDALDDDDDAAPTPSPLDGWYVMGGSDGDPFAVHSSCSQVVDGVDTLPQLVAAALSHECPRSTP